MTTTTRTGKGPLVLLFYDGFELKAAPGLAGAAYSQGRRLARYTWRNLRRKQVRTGFYAAFLSLRRSLEQAGCDVRVNDFAAARRRPDHQIGVAGYPTVLAKTDHLPNPRIFGPGDFGGPEESAAVAADPRFRTLIQPCEWFCDLYRPSCGDKLLAWPVGIDTEAWPDMAGEAKSLDVVIYDKVRWERETRVPQLVDAARAHLDARGLTHETLRYGEHHQSQFRSAVRRGRALLFVCEHETQGLAYQEAMAADMPVIAWDEGELVDPYLARYAPPGLAVSAVPYFDARCGTTYRAGGFAEAFDRFWAARADYRPREYVLETLSMERAAQTYLQAYGRAGGDQGSTAGPREAKRA